MPARKKKTTKKAITAKPKVVKAKRRLLEIVNISSSDFELFINDTEGVSIFWMTPQKSILVPYKPPTPQLEEMKRRQMVSVTEVHR
tara:strand:- start:655 stop:912 length:258 start_codon:yes stop_codon:yes gene_type:complete